MIYKIDRKKWGGEGGGGGGGVARLLSAISVNLTVRVMLTIYSAHINAHVKTVIIKPLKQYNYGYTDKKGRVQQFSSTSRMLEFGIHHSILLVDRCIYYTIGLGYHK